MVEPVNKAITVWCPTTGNRNWIARRNGTVYITGNCGLIQFIERTAQYIGTSTSALKKMSAVEQLDYVQRYLAPYSPRIRSLEDMYLSILWPAAVGKPLDLVLWRKGDPVYKVNKGLDTNNNGSITKREAAQKARDHLAEGLKPGNVWTPGGYV